MPNIAQVGDLGGRRGNARYGELADSLFSLAELQECLNQGLQSDYTMCEKRLTVRTGQACELTLCCCFR